MSLNTISQEEFFNKFKKGDKKWYMKGEVTANDTIDKETNATPLDDDIEITNRHVGTSNSRGMSLERVYEIIKKKIINKDFNDPVRKVRPTNIEKKEIEISGEKSKLSLADEYMNAYKKEEECLRLRGTPFDEVRKDLRVLFNDLDALFHQNHVPIKYSNESKPLFGGDSNGIEEIGVSRAHVLPKVAPQEILKESKISRMKGTTERSKLDRKRKKKIIGKQIEKKRKLAE